MPKSEVEGQWGPPFPREEYVRRWDAARQEMKRRGIDLLYVTSPPNITYLTGYDSIWYYLVTPTGVALRTDSEEVIFFDSISHADLVPEVSITAQNEYFSGRRAEDIPSGIDRRVAAGRASVSEVLEKLKARGWLKGTAGVERWGRGPAGALIVEIESQLRESGLEVVDGSWTVDKVRVVKSSLEVEYVRKAAEIADAGMNAVRDFIRPGVTEIEIQACAHYAMGMLGGEEPAIRTAIRSGPRGAAHHSTPTRRIIQPGDIVWVDFSGSYYRYHVDIARIFSVGEPDSRWIDLYEKAAGSVDKVVAQVRPGDPTMKVQEIADAHIDEMGLRKYVWWIGGYEMGISIPPDWVGPVFYDGGYFDQDFVPGLVMNYENVFDITQEDWPGGKGGSFIETLLMTENGIEVLSKIPRTMIVL